MMRYLTALFLLLACAVGAADLERVTLTITVTNPPVTGYSLTVNSSERIWTNATTSTTILTNSTVNNSATNLFLHIAASPFGSPRLILQWANTNQIKLISQPGQAISATTNGLWATLSLSTQSGPQTVAAYYPFANIVGDTNRTNQASHFVRGMSDYATNAFATNAMALSAFITKGIPAGGSQTVTGATVFHKLSGTNNGTIYGGHYQDGTLTNRVIHTAKLYHNSGIFTNWGLLFYDSSTNQASYIFSDAVGFPQLRGADGDPLDISADPDDAHILNFKSAREIFPNRIPYGSTYSNYWTTTNTYAGQQYFSATAFLTSPVLYGGYVSNATGSGLSLTNTQLRGTNTVRGDLSFDARVNVDAANGNNTGLLLGTNVYLRIMGPSAAYTNGGFVAERAGAYHILQMTNPAITCVIVNDALDGTAENRILTGTGADLVLTNNPAFLQIIYDGAASRWRVITHSR